MPARNPGYPGNSGPAAFGGDVTGETPEDIFRAIESDLDVIANSITSIETGVPSSDCTANCCAPGGHSCWRELGGYYLCKFRLRWTWSGMNTPARLLSEKLRSAIARRLIRWRALSAIGASHYLPYRMSRVGMTFGWSYYIDEVENDIRIAERIEPLISPEARGRLTGHCGSLPSSTSTIPIAA